MVANGKKLFPKLVAAMVGKSKIEVAKKLLILKDEVASQNILGGNSPGI